MGAQHPAAQRLQYFLSEAAWDAGRSTPAGWGCWPTRRRRPRRGVLVIDDTGDRKDGTHTAHVGPAVPGLIGKVDNGIVAVTSLWADERVYYPLHVEPYTPARRLPKGGATRPSGPSPSSPWSWSTGRRRGGALPGGGGRQLLRRQPGLRGGPGAGAGCPTCWRLKPSKGTGPREDAAAHAGGGPAAAGWAGPARAGEARATGRGSCAATATATPRCGGRPSPASPATGRRARCGLVVATTDPATLPPADHLVPGDEPARPDGPPRRDAPFAPADLAEVVRLYGLRNWVEQGYKQVKHELGWADFQVRTDRAIRRHWALVCCAFSFCWRAWFTTLDAPGPPGPRPPVPPPTTPARPRRARGKRTGGRGAGPRPGPRAAPRPPGLALLAGRAAPRAELARALDQSLAHLARLVQVTPPPSSSGSSTSSATATPCTSTSGRLAQRAERPWQREPSRSGTSSRLRPSSRYGRAPAAAPHRLEDGPRTPPASPPSMSRLPRAGGPGSAVDGRAGRRALSPG